ncbi:adenylate/guanylate cyclase domain-containing protein [Terasakiella sp. A23]|uniref:adenylate/guanylate cyclase domain-containing protein n=1 Tax=Terasakiella sp. FCG-A23 TaxID=3080561 RepID=UPI002953534F|nr:adenylate/guanylate cyclase domain-containing protein [Terasakiella sp. A23]MDV7338857.1 adenylate/guanylate cyclase domain-containing protein [Terasakiella sp. A23]
MNLWRKITFTRQPIQNVLFVGFGGLILLAVAVVLYLGLNATTKLTKDYHHMLIETALDKMQKEVENLLLPVENQALWISDQVKSNDLRVDDFGKVETFLRGILGATPNVTGAGIQYPDGITRYVLRSENRWVVDQETTTAEDNARLFKVMAQHTTSHWGELFFFDDLGQTLVDIRTPLYQDGELKGVLFIAVTVAELSKTILAASTDQFLTPFILYGEDHILAHPLLTTGSTITPEQSDKTDWVEGKGEVPLPKLKEFHDPKLIRLRSSDVAPARLITPINDVVVKGARIDDDMHIVATRDLLRFGKKPWITGVYINAEKSDRTVVMQLFEMAGAGIVVLFISVVLSIKVGRKIARPIVRLADTARMIRKGVTNPIQQLPRSRLKELDQAALAFNDMIEGLRERDLIREVFGRYVPESIAASLMHENGELKPIQTEATILFSDIEGFTQLTEKVGPERIVGILNSYFSTVVDVLERHGGVVTQFQGDAVLATFNVPIEDENHAQNALNAAMEIKELLCHQEFDGVSLKSRIGLNTGTVVAGAVGAKGRLNYTVHGDAVNLAARIESLNKKFGTCILISEDTAKLIKHVELKSIGSTEVRGRSAHVHLFVINE